MRTNSISVKQVLWLGYLLVLFLVAFGQIVSSQDNSPHAATITIYGKIDKPEARILDKSIKRASENGARLVILLINTPGGDLESTRKMVRSIYDSAVPIVTFVWPSGSRAASAGTFLLAAGNVAAMAPSTNVGAATPVSITGEDLPGTIADKATQDAASFLRSIAFNRDRNVEAYEATVIKAKAYSEIEAFEAGVINMVSEDPQQLLIDLDGYAIKIGETDIVLNTSDLVVQAINPGFLDQFLRFLANPNIALILIAIGFLGILIELINPGGFIAGITGVAAIVLALVALGNLPVNWMGFLLIGLAATLFYIEVQVSGLGIAGLIGGALFIVGAILLFGGFSEPDLNGPSFMANIWILVGISIFIGLLLIILIKASLNARKHQYKADEKIIIGQLAKTITELNPIGTIYLSGEEWSAVSESGVLIKPDSQVLITNKEKLILRVRPYDSI